MPSRGQSIVAIYEAYDVVAEDYKTGDVANHTIRLIKDGVLTVPTNTPTEISAASRPGAYGLVLTTTEATAHVVDVGGVSSTANVRILPATYTFEQLPTAVAGAANGLLILANQARFVTLFDTPIGNSAWTIGNLFALVDAWADSGRLDLILDAILAASLSAGEVESLWSGLTEVEITIRPGDDYDPTTRPFRISVEGGPDLTDATVQFVITCAGTSTGTIQTEGDGTITGSGTALDPWIVTAGRLESEETDKLTEPGVETGRMVATLDSGDIYTFPFDWKINVSKEVQPVEPPAP